MVFEINRAKVHIIFSIYNLHLNTMAHQHKYDETGKQLCCTLENKIERRTKKAFIAHNTHKGHNHEHSPEHDDEQNHEQGHSHGHEHSHGDGDQSTFRMFLPSIVSFILLVTAILFDHFINVPFWTKWVRPIWYIIAYLPVGIPVLKEAIEAIRYKEIFTEFLLMSIASIGAFAIGEYPEGVAVMVFYSVGEVFQELAVRKAKNNIRDLLDQRPDTVIVVEDNEQRTVSAQTVGIGAVVQLKPGEKLALDGVLLSDMAAFNTSALTGESQPDTKEKGETVLAGMINLNTVALVEVTTEYKDSKLSRILELVQNASEQKAKTELFIRKFARYYTPAVTFAAIAIIFIPALFVQNYVFSEWLYRGLVFLVASCPCALVISIPLSYFGGIGAASRKGILFKGGNYLDAMAKIRNVVMDKTGTLTKGVFNVQEVNIKPEFDKNELLQWVNAIESKSTHPVATAIHNYAGKVDSSIMLGNVEEFAGLGLQATVNGTESVLAGNVKLLDKFGIEYDSSVRHNLYTTIAIAVNGAYAGYISIADEIKDDAVQAIKDLHALGVKTTMLSGDKAAVVADVALKLGIDMAYGDLLPEDKVNRVKEIKASGESVAFVGDGVNDAPVVALSDVGIAMGGLGSDATIETADVVIQDDRPSQIAVSIDIGKATKRIVWQNIFMALIVKAVVLTLGALGLANMWEAVFADVGVALLAILNAMRLR